MENIFILKPPSQPSPKGEGEVQILPPGGTGKGVSKMKLLDNNL
jgi:hypothetical protein